jgi:hypothetical protein
MKKPALFVLVSLICLFSLHVKAQLPGYIPGDSLVAWWPFSGNADDLSGHGNHGTISGAQLVTDRFGNEASSYDFFNPNDHILVPAINQASIAGNFTIAAWVYFRNFNIDYPHLLSGMNNYFAFHGQGPTYYPENEKVGFYTTTSTSSHQGLIVSQDALTMNSWHHVIINKSGNEVRMYVNNQLSAYNTYENQPLMQGEGLYIGNFYGLGNPIDGRIDDVGIWQRSLSEEEMSAIFNATNTGTQENSGEGWITITPNPASDYFSVSAIQQYKEVKWVVGLYTLAGNKVMQVPIDSENPSVKLESSLANGLYLIRITAESGNCSIRKLMINH